MKTKSIIAIALLIFSVKSTAQRFNQTHDEKTIMTIGFLNGGGSLVGADLEFKVANHFGAQIGAGFFGYGAGLNYHFKPGIRNSFLSLQYWHQGLNSSVYQTWVGPVYVYRAPKWFTVSVGLGLNAGGTIVDTPATLLFSIGGYFPL